MINFSSYTLTNKNYFSECHSKKYIIIGNTFNLGMNHFIGWKLRSNGSYKKVANYTIDIDGTIYQHFDPSKYSIFLPNSTHNKEIISILLSNRGWFDYNINQKKYVNCLGISHSGDNLMEKRWRSHSYWDEYSEEQMKSLSNLVKELILKFNIPNQILTHNTYVKDIYKYEGISYKSNWIKDCTDLSPSFNFEIFKNKIEENGI